MRHETAGAELLQAARDDTDRRRSCPDWRVSQRYAALMVANALKMVERELAVNGQPACGRPRRAERSPGLPTPRTSRRKALGRALRAGRHDGDPRLHQALYARAIQAVAITRPDILTPAELGKTV